MDDYLLSHLISAYTGSLVDDPRTRRMCVDGDALADVVHLHERTKALFSKDDQLRGDLLTAFASQIPREQRAQVILDEIPQFIAAADLTELRATFYEACAQQRADGHGLRIVAAIHREKSQRDAKQWPGLMACDNANLATFILHPHTGNLNDDELIQVLRFQRGTNLSDNVAFAQLVFERTIEDGADAFEQAISSCYDEKFHGRRGAWRVFRDAFGSALAATGATGIGAFHELRTQISAAIRAYAETNFINDRSESRVHAVHELAYLIHVAEGVSWADAYQEAGVMIRQEKPTGLTWDSTRACGDMNRLLVANGMVHTFDDLTHLRTWFFALIDLHKQVFVHAASSLTGSEYVVNDAICSGAVDTDDIIANAQQLVHITQTHIAPWVKSPSHKRREQLMLCALMSGSDLPDLPEWVERLDDEIVCEQTGRHVAMACADIIVSADDLIHIERLVRRARRDAHRVGTE